MNRTGLGFELQVPSRGLGTLIDIAVAFYNVSVNSIADSACVVSLALSTRWERLSG